MKQGWALRGAPESVRLRWPSAINWTWLSPYRLRGEGHSGKTIYLVVVDPYNEQRVAGQDIPHYRAADRAYVSETYGLLRLQLAVDIAARLACADGAPIRAEHSALTCRACGRLWDTHDGLGLEAVG
ncbi:hypothetical protein Nocox_35630 [Nonomuraea coxensis DSM 45129]|uniref:Transposase n=1 Tax=Nonomuraea coxensis DSM 45129 TaxID=1122611 RepID=A0ABX8UAY4_9ACTN|nr:hypothetical protein [Nonomuraea coxensis]QYC44685.1 hypothetical protein Nocox_35630 [Nonomuraea coxensis DSM 45129]